MFLNFPSHTDALDIELYFENKLNMLKYFY